MASASGHVLVTGCAVSCRSRMHVTCAQDPGAAARQPGLRKGLHHRACRGLVLL